MFNALNAISALVRQDDRTLALKGIRQLSDLLRYALVASERASVTLADELQFTRDYLALQRLRYRDRLQVQIEGESGEVLGADCPPLLVVDDEEPGRINLRHALATQPGWILVGECADAASARAFLGAQQVDLVLLDIDMPFESGLELARTLAVEAQPPLIVFVTAHDAHALEAFAVHALDYLLKPIDDEDLARALARAAALVEQRELAAHANALRAWAATGTGTDPVYLSQLNVHSVGRIDCVRLDEVMWIEAAGNYVKLHMQGRGLLHRVPIGALERHLDPDCFVRVHRSAIVRADQVAGLHTDVDGVRKVLLRCGSAVPVSDRHVARVRPLLGA